MEKLKAGIGWARIGVFITTAFLSASLYADVSPTPPPAKPGAGAPTQAQGDPFVKKDAVAPAVETGPVSNQVATFGVYTLGQNDGNQLLQENTTDQTRYDRLQDLVKNGKAHLDVVLSGTVQSGERLSIEQTDQLKYAIAFDPPSGGRISPFPTDYGTRGLGYRVVVKGQLLEKNTYNLVVEFEYTKLEGFINDQPLFESVRAPLGPLNLPYGKIQFLSSLASGPPSAILPKPNQTNSPVESEMKLLFAKIDSIPLNPALPVENESASLEYQFSYYSMNRDKAWEILSQNQETDSAYNAVQSLVKSNEAKLEHLSILKATTNIVNQFKENYEELPYATAFEKGSPPVPREFMTQDIGFGGTIKATFNHSFLDIDLDNISIINYLGNLPAEDNAAPYDPMPTFEVRRIMTRFHSVLGQHELIGTCSPAGNTGLKGREDTGRVWLLFLQTTAVNP